MRPVQKCVEVYVVYVACAWGDVCRSYCYESFLGVYCDCEHICLEVVHLYGIWSLIAMAALEWIVL